MHAHEKPLNGKLGKVNGYIIEYKSGSEIYRIYWSGDTVWFDVVQIRKYGEIDLFIPNMGAVGADGTIGRRGLDAKDCLKFIETLNPKTIIPIHHSTFSHYAQPISKLRELLEHKNCHQQLKIMKENTAIDLDTKAVLVSSNLKVRQKYFTGESDIKKSSIIDLEPNSFFHTNNEFRTDIYMIEGELVLNDKEYDSNTFISIKNDNEITSKSNGCKLFVYEEPLKNESNFSLVVTTKSDLIRNNGGVKGMKNALLSSHNHSTMLVSWEPGTKVPFHIHDKGQEIFVIKGELFDRETSIKEGQWVRMLPNTGHEPNTKETTLILLRNGHL